MAKVYNTTDEAPGVPVPVSGPRAVMHPYNFQNIAATQAQTYERLTNQDADGSGSPAAGNEGHVHIEDHNQPHLPLLFRSYGNENVPRGSDDRPLTAVNYVTEQTDVVLIYSPFYVPSGTVDRSLLLVMHIEGDGAPGVKATLATWSGGPPKTPTTVTGHDRLTLRPGTEHPALADNPTRDTLWWVRLYPAAAGLHTIKIATDMEDAEGSNLPNITREIRSILIMNEPHWGSMAGAPHVAKPAPPASNLVDVGDSRNANGWTCPTDTLYPSNGIGPGMLSPGVRFLALNDAWLQEKGLGIPAAGQATKTVSAGHNHNGVAGNGAEMEIPILALPVGRPQNESLIFGNGSAGPSTSSNSYSQVLEFEIYTPDHTYALDEGGNPRLYCAVLMHGEHSKTGGVVTRVTTTESTPGTSAVEYGTDAGLASPHFELVTSASAFTFTPAGITKVEVELKVVSGAATGPGTLMGLCFWIEP